MPRIVDREERLGLIRRAAVKLIVEGGVAAVSFRNVAEESGINIGSVRHFAGTHEQLLRGVAEAVSAPVRARVKGHQARLGAVNSPDERLDIVIDILEELVPLDELRTTEAVIWLAFTEHARVHGDTSGSATHLDHGIRRFTSALLEGAGVAEPAVPAEAMACVLDGLAIGMLRAPDAYDHARVRAVLRWQLLHSLN